MGKQEEEDVTGFAVPTLKDLFYGDKYDDYLELMLQSSPQGFYTLTILLTLELQIEREKLRVYGSKFN